MASPFIMKLRHGAALTEQDCSQLEAALGQTRQFKAGQDIIEQGARPEAVHVVLKGYAGRYKMLPNGERQIVAYLLPGDTCDLNVVILGHMDHSIVALSACEVAYLATSALDELLTQPAIARALWWSTLVDEGTLREWLVSMGRRSSEQQMAHLFCELRYRLAAVGLVAENKFGFPLTQAELADTLGITAVHTNRILQQLRALGLITLSGGQLTIHGVEGLEALADFDPGYLHRSPRSPVAYGNQRHLQAPTGHARPATDPRSKPPS